MLIYSAILDKYKDYICKVITRLGEASLFLDINKCKFTVKKVKYLRLIFITKGIKIDPIKV